MKQIFNIYKFCGNVYKNSQIYKKWKESGKGRGIEKERQRGEREIGREIDGQRECEGVTESESERDKQIDIWINRERETKRDVQIDRQVRQRENKKG